MNIPQRQFSKEEVNRCYLRWQQLRNEHGMNAPSVPEFIYLTKVLQVAAKQQPELQMQRRQQGMSVSQHNTASASPNQVDLPNNTPSHISASASPNLAPNMPLNGNESFATAAHQSPAMSAPIPLDNNSNNNNIPEQRQSSMTSLNGNNFSQAAANNVENVADKPANTTHNGYNPNISEVQPQSRSPQDHNMQDSNALPGSQINSPMPQQTQMQQAQFQAQQAQIQAQQAQQAQFQAQQTQQTQVPPQQGRRLPMTMFTAEQSELLKAQITSLKCLVNRKPIPLEFQAVIQKSINHPPDFKRMLLSLSEFAKRRQPVDQNGKLNNNNSNDMQQPTVEAEHNNVNLDQPAAEVANNTPLEDNNNDITPLPPIGPSNKPNVNSPPVKNLRTVSNTPIAQANLKIEENEASSNEDKAVPIIDKNPTEQNKPPTPQKPVPLSVLQEQYKEGIKVVDIDDPDMMVDSFTMPNICQNNIDYLTLLANSDHARFLIEPGVLPVGIDTHTATDIYQTLIALNLDATVNDCLDKLLDDDCEGSVKEDALYDYYALQLLPLQKAVRGHILQFEWHQNSLLTNTHPNFLSKIRNVNAQDALLTNQLYKNHELLKLERKKLEVAARLKSMNKSAISQYNKRQDKKNKRLKFGHRLIATHANLERDEQKLSLIHI